SPPHCANARARSVFAANDDRSARHARCCDRRIMGRAFTLALLSAGALAGAIGCTGEVGENDHGPPEFDGTSLLCTVPDPGPAPIRRLTRFEYDNTVADLL